MTSLKNKIIHFGHPLITNPVHNITVSVIGCGGTGSKVLTQLAMINAMRVTRREYPLEVFAYDDDLVSESNIGRQAFSPADIGRNKATVLIERINRFYGLDWHDVPYRYERNDSRVTANITITCTDTLSSRRYVRNTLKNFNKTNADKYQPIYWIDTGNETETGQVIMSSVSRVPQPKFDEGEACHYLRNPFEMYPELETQPDDDNTPSCSAAESLTRQGLFINSLVGTYTGVLLWEFLRHGYIDFQGYYINIKKVTQLPL